MNPTSVPPAMGNIVGQTEHSMVWQLAMDIDNSELNTTGDLGYSDPRHDI